VSRKITKFTTKKVTANQIDIFANAATFVGEIAEIIRSNSPECVFNSDQSGFSEEFHSGRTLNAQGEKIVLAEAQCMNALTQGLTNAIWRTGAKPGAGVQCTVHRAKSASLGLTRLDPARLALGSASCCLARLRYLARAMRRMALFT